MRTSPIGGLVPPISPRLTDPDAERARREHHEKIVELQQLPAASLRVIKDVSLPDGTAVAVNHGLGRRPAWVAPSAVRSPSASGRIEEVRDSAHDRTQVVVLKASGYGATVTVDVAVL